MANLTVRAEGYIVVPVKVAFTPACCGRSNMMGDLARLQPGDLVEVEDSSLVQAFVKGGMLTVMSSGPDPEPELLLFDDEPVTPVAPKVQRRPRKPR